MDRNALGYLRDLVQLSDVLFAHVNYSRTLSRFLGDGGIEPDGEDFSLDGIPFYRTVADTHSPGMTPDSGGCKQKPQARRGERGVLHLAHLAIFLAVEKLQPALQAVAQHPDMEQLGVHHPAI